MVVVLIALTIILVVTSTFPGLLGRNPMSLRRTFAVALNELRHITRDTRTLFW